MLQHAPQAFEAAWRDAHEPLGEVFKGKELTARVYIAHHLHT
jgi:hypothetical protein